MHGISLLTPWKINNNNFLALNSTSSSEFLRYLNLNHAFLPYTLEMIENSK